MTADLIFVDTNILLYAHDRSAGMKHEIARDFVAQRWGSRSGVLSTQVLQEFYVNATRKLPRPMIARPCSSGDRSVRHVAGPPHRPGGHHRCIGARDTASALVLGRAHHHLGDASRARASWRQRTSSMGAASAALTVVNPFAIDRSG